MSCVWLCPCVWLSVQARHELPVELMVSVPYLPVRRFHSTLRSMHKDFMAAELYAVQQSCRAYD